MMKHWKEYRGHEKDISGKKNKFDKNIYSFDIETTSYFILNGKQFPAIEYDNLSKEEKEDSIPMACMYIWMFSINEQVYYGRTWDELYLFWEKVDLAVPERKIVFVHNLSFEFQFLRTRFNFHDVMARKSRHVMRCYLNEFNFEFRCSLYMSNVSLEKLPKLFNLPIEKKTGFLDYSKIRHSGTPLDEKELEYCENDCLVIYHYILEELKSYKNVDRIPMTSTGHVRRELRSIVMKSVSYKAKVNKAINTDPHIYNMLVDAFQGGYTHANWIYTDEVINNVDSYDFTSSYPYILVTHKFPSTEFKRCTNITKVEQMSFRKAYLLTVKMNDISSKYYNNFISKFACKEIKSGKYDNGRIISADYVIMTITDVDFRFFLECYNYSSYEILEIYDSTYNYLPIEFINFVLKKYVIKTEYKGIEEKAVEYAKEKNKFNSLYGMSVTNTIRNEVVFDNRDWKEVELSNEDIITKLEKEKKQSFLSFAYGVWVTAFARSNLLKNVMKLDPYVIYCDTDSIKLAQGYDKKVIDDYNDFVKRKIEFVSDLLEIDINKYQPKDIKGQRHLLGVFECETEKGREFTYDKFITQGAKKYATEVDGKIKITVAGVPKSGANGLKDLNDFRDNYVFKYKDTNKNLLMYTEEMNDFDLIDYNGEKYHVSDKYGCCLLPTTYVLGKALEYVNLLDMNSSERSKYRE